MVVKRGGKTIHLASRRPLVNYPIHSRFYIARTCVAFVHRENATPSTDSVEDRCAVQITMRRRYSGVPRRPGGLWRPYEQAGLQSEADGVVKRVAERGQLASKEASLPVP